MPHARRVATVAQRLAAKDAHALGRGGRERGRGPAGLARRADGLPAARRRDRGAARGAARRGGRPRRPVRHGRLVAGARGHLRDRRRAARRPRRHRPGQVGRAVCRPTSSAPSSWCRASPAPRSRPTASAAPSSPPSRRPASTPPGGSSSSPTRARRWRRRPPRPATARVHGRPGRGRAATPPSPPSGWSRPGWRAPTSAPCSTRPRRCSRGCRRPARTTRRSCSARPWVPTQNARARAATSSRSSTTAPAWSASATGPSSSSPSPPARTAPASCRSWSSRRAGGRAPRPPTCCVAHLGAPGVTLPRDDAARVLVTGGARRADAALGGRHRGRRPAAGHQPVRPARRREREEGGPRAARRAPRAVARRPHRRAASRCAARPACSTASPTWPARSRRCSPRCRPTATSR